ncbi:MAG: glycosyltransferase family 4 protein [Chitinophagales bacterium]|nr:glycosyltransferase family 4 protein [Chitinophagales bacterium]
MQKILIIALRFPELTTGAGKRMMQLIDYFLVKKFEIVFVSAANKTPYSYPLQELGIKEYIFPINNTAFDVFVKQYQPTICLFDRFIAEEQFSWRVKENAPYCKFILDTEDLHFLRAAREKGIKNGLTEKENYWNDALTIREMSAMLRCDVSLIISKYEMELLINEFQLPNEQLYFVPMYQIPNQTPIKTFKERENFVFIGNYLHKPNVDAVEYLKKKLWHKIKQQLPNAELHIYGAYLPKNIQAYHNVQDGFIIKGFADNVAQTLNSYRLMLAPLRFGAGQKAKLLDAVQVALPFVVSHVAAEGMFSKEEYPFIINEIDSFVEKSVHLYQNEVWYSNAQEKIKEILETHFSKNNFTKKMDFALHLLKQNNLSIYQKFYGKINFLPPNT